MVDRTESDKDDRALKAVKHKVPPTAFDPIAAALQQIHTKVTDEDIPDDFMKLLDKFDARKFG